jgi:hypothetical protein
MTDIKIAVTAEIMAAIPERNVPDTEYNYGYDVEKNNYPSKQLDADIDRMINTDVELIEAVATLKNEIGNQVRYEEKKKSIIQKNHTKAVLADPDYWLDCCYDDVSNV